MLVAVLYPYQPGGHVYFIIAQIIENQLPELI